MIHSNEAHTMAARGKQTFSPYRLVNHVDVFVGIGIVSILLVMIIPLPAPFLDLLLALNITLSLVTLLVAIYTTQPLDFSIFPSLLLSLTLFRLSLNISSTRLILLYGNQGPSAAGEVIRSFGSFVVGGNFVVGIIIFSILVLVNFIVITKGASRIAEVGARFTLDAMPGKQMGIDADLNAGVINDEEARRRRQAIQLEADFYGAMDGASKFVSGDAIVGIIITLVNVVGGIIIGILQQGLELQAALQSYTILTVGDGLVSQLPALIVSTAAGFLATKVSTDVNLGQQVTSQLFAHPRVIWSVSGLLLLLGIIPGLPLLPLLTLAAISGVAAFLTSRAQHSLPDDTSSAELTTATRSAALAEASDMIPPIDRLELEVGYSLISLVDVEREGELLERIKAMRNQLAQELGIIIPAVRIRDDLQLNPSEYTVRIKGIEVARAELMLGHLLAMHPTEEMATNLGISTKEPAFGLPAIWIKDDEREKIQLQGYTVVDIPTIIITHLTEIVKKHIHELLSREEVQKLIDRLSQDYPKVIEELFPSQLSLGVVQKVLQNLLREHISVRDLLTILETLADYVSISKDPLVLTEYVRHSLSRSITHKWQTADGEIPALLLDFELESELTKAIQSTDHGSYLALEPSLGQRLIAELNRRVGAISAQQLVPILITGPLLRPHLQRITEPFLPDLIVLSQNEVASHVRIRNLGILKA